MLIFLTKNFSLSFTSKRRLILFSITVSSTVAFIDSNCLDITTSSIKSSILSIEFIE